MDKNDRSLTVFTMLGHMVFHTYELAIPIFVVIWLDVFSVAAAVIGLIVGIGTDLSDWGHFRVVSLWIDTVRNDSFSVEWSGWGQGSFFSVSRRTSLF